jgi:hypothetical protein
MNVVSELKKHIDTIKYIDSNPVLGALKCKSTRKDSVNKLLDLVEITEFIEAFFIKNGHTPEISNIPHSKRFKDGEWNLRYTDVLRVLGLKKTIKCQECGKIEESARPRRLCSECNKNIRVVRGKKYYKNNKLKVLEDKEIERESEFHKAFKFGSKS